jgi:TrmH family RNA methyltransferase
MNEIVSRKNPLVVHMKKLGADSGYRHEHGEFLCDGEKLLKEALAFGADITSVLYSSKEPEGLPEHVPSYVVAYDILESVSPLKTPQDVIFSCRLPDGIVSPITGGFHIILEGIQDPGNVGTILRTAGAFNTGSVILTGDCADPYNPKTIRATMGAIFRQHMTVMELDGIRALKDNGFRIYGAALGADSRDVRDVSFQNAAVAIGSEGRGLSPELLSMCDEKIIIPMSPNCESLNAAVAASIIMWEATRFNV